LPPAPRFCATAQLTDLGIVLGEGVVVAPLVRRFGAAGVLAVDGREAEIFALLSLAQGKAIRPNVLHGFHGVSKALAQGEVVGAVIRLAQIGVAPLRGPRDAEMLKAGATCLAKGFATWAILQAAGIEEGNVRLAKADWSEDLHPRDSATGQFTSTGSAQNSASVAVSASVAARLIAGGATPIAAGTVAPTGGVLLVLTAAGWVLSHGPKGDIHDGPSYWLPGVPEDKSGTASGGAGTASASDLIPSNSDSRATITTSGESPADAADPMQQCEDLYRIDTDTCRAIARRRGARSGAACYASASERYAACLSGRTIPPLNTWNN
jgi:hypothetical protein